MGKNAWLIVVGVLVVTLGIVFAITHGVQGAEDGYGQDYSNSHTHGGY